jgi:hypothetical protein
VMSGGPIVAATEKMIRVRTKNGRKEIGMNAVAMSSAKIWLV